MAAPALPLKVDSQVALEFTVTFRCGDPGSYSAVLRAENVIILLTASVQQRLTYRVENAPLGNIVDFGSALRGTAIRRRFTVVNETSQVFTVPAIVVAGADFTFAALPPSGNMLSPQQSVEFAVDFAASTAGPHQAVLILGDRSVMMTAVALDPPLPQPLISVNLQTPASAQQGNLIIAFDQPAASSGTGTAVLDFRGSADPTVAFASGGRTANFTVSAGDTRVSLPFQTGTTTGTVVFTVRLGDTSGTIAVEIPPSLPALSQVQALHTLAGIETIVTGWDNTHSISQLVFTFFDAAGNAVAPGAIRVDASGEFTRFYSISDLGGSFSLRAIFPVTGDAAQVAAFEVTVVNPAGAAKSARIPIQ